MLLIKADRSLKGVPQLARKAFRGLSDHKDRKASAVKPELPARLEQRAQQVQLGRRVRKCGDSGGDRRE